MICLQEVDRLQQRLAEMTTRETANGNLQNKIKVGSLFRSSSKAKMIKVSRDNKIPHANPGMGAVSMCCQA